MSLGFLIHKLEIIVDKSLYSTIIMGYYVVTRLRKGSFWNLPLAFLDSLLLSCLKAFSNIISTFSKEEGGPHLKAFCLGIRLRNSEETNICETWVQRVGKTQMPLAVLCIRSKGHERDPPKNNVNLPSFHFPINVPIICYGILVILGRGANWVVIGEIHIKQKSSYVWGNGYTFGLDTDFSVLASITLMGTKKAYES